MGRSAGSLTRLRWLCFLSGFVVCCGAAVFCGVTVFCCLAISPAPAGAAWLPDGTPLCDLPDDQSATQAVSDGGQGAIVVWVDYRSGSSAIYAQRVDANGTPLWTPEGVAVCTAPGSKSTPIIASDEAGGAVIAWGDYRNGNHDLYAQRMDADGSALWTNNGVAVCTAAGYQFASSIIPAGGGGVIVAWEDSRGGAYYDIYAQRLNGADGASLWVADGRQICGAANSQYSPQAVSDGAMGAIIAWYDYRNGNYDIYAQRVNMAGTTQWTWDGVVVCTASYEQAGQRITTDGAGGAIIAWQDYRSASNYDIYAQRLTSVGSPSWTANGVGVCTAAGPQIECQMISDGSGGAIMSWSDERGANFDIYGQRVNSAGTAQWTANGVAVCAAPNGQARSVLATDGLGGAIIAWDDGRAGDYSDIYAQRIHATGLIMWSPNGVAVCSAADNQWYPAIVSDNFNGAIITWEDYRSGTSYDAYAGHVDGGGGAGWTNCGVPISTYMNNQTSVTMVSDEGQGGIMVWEDYRGGSTNPDIYGQRVFPDGTTLWSRDGLPITTAVSYQIYPDAAPDGSGGVLVAWQDLRNGNYDVYAQRISAIQAALWRTNGAVVCSTAAGTYQPKIASDGSGGAIVVWENLISGGTSDIFGQRLDASGNQMWAAAGVAVCNATNYQQYPEILSDGVSGAFVVWTDMRGASQDTYAQRVNGSGASLWTANGVVVSGATGSQNNAKVVSDGAGGVIVCWKDSRNGNYDVYAQRLNSSGIPQWTADGVVVCNWSGNQQNAALVPDGAGGVIVCWEDYRNGNADVYAQRLNSSGVAQWTGGGVAVCTATGAQSTPKIVTDGSGGAIVTWQDGRSGGLSDVYAERLGSAGNVMWGTDGIAVCASDEDDTRPVLTYSASGQAIVAWAHYSDLTAGDVYALSTGYIIGVPEEPAPPATVSAVVRLDQNFPNPFNPVTKIAFTLTEAARVRLCVYDVAGRIVRVLVDGPRDAGRHEVVWDGTDGAGVKAASGVYFCGLEAPGASSRVVSRKMVIVR